MPSLRSSGKIVGSSVSIRQLAQDSRPTVPFPLSLRELLQTLGVPPHSDRGFIRKKVVPLEIFQRKFDEFVNERERPLFKFRLHGEEFGKSELTTFFEDPVDGVLKEFGKPTDLRDDGGDLEIDAPGPFNPNYHFSNLETERITLNITSDPPGSPPEIEVRVHFEIKHEELKINNFFNIDFTGLDLTLRFPLLFDITNGLVGLLGFVELVEQAMREVKVERFPGIPGKTPNTVKLTVEFRGNVFKQQGPEASTEALKQNLKKDLFKEFINTDASVDVAGLPDGVVAREIEGTLNEKLLEALQKRLQDQEEEPGIIRPGINRRLTRLLLGGDFTVVGAWSNGRVLTIDYMGGSQIDPFPERSQPPLDPGLLSNINHIVVLMMENRSFDHMLGYLSKHGGRADVDGLRGGEKNRFKERDFPSFPLTDTQFIAGPCHDHACVVTQVDGGKMDGFVADFAPRAEAAAAKGFNVNPGDVMGYYDAAKVPVYDALAREFLICQRWFCSHPGPTWPNRFYGLTGRLNRDANGRTELDNPQISDFAPVSTKTIFDHLTDQGVSWHYYEYGFCFLRLFDRYTFDISNILDARDPVNGFFAAAQAGTLPSVSFVDPDFIDVPPGSDDHPPADIARGQHLIAEVVRAVINGPLWSKTLLVITYDEHGGFFDHVPPPTAPVVSGIDRYGPRVPAFVISPWVDRGKVTDVVFDHTSILKTIARRFLSPRPPDLGERVAEAQDLSMVLRSTARQDRPDIPLPPAPVPNVALARRAELVTEGDRSFHALLRSMRFLFFMG